MTQPVTIEPSWKTALKEEFESQYFGTLTKAVREAYLKKGAIYPPPKEIFKAFELCPFDAVKVVILGQDPYHKKGQAHGLCFSVRDGVPIPPSLRNVFKELHDDLNVPVPETGNLERWATQGVLLLNATLTVESGKPGSHYGLGWETFTDAVVRTLSHERTHLVFMLWGAHAQKKGAHIDVKKHLVLTAAHPSPLSAHNGFFGCRHFSKANQYLTTHHITPIVW